MEKNFYNNYYIFNTNYINRLLTMSFILIWSICFTFTQPKPPKKNKNQIVNQFISSRGIGLGFIIVSMLLEIIADLITINENSNQNLENYKPDLKFSSKILWNFSLALKSIAMFIALGRYFPLTNSLSKEVILSPRIHNFSIYFNLISGIMVYPSLICVLVLYETTWSQSMFITEFYYIFQMTICLIFFLILNIKMKIAINEGLLFDLHGIQQFRVFCSRNYFIIGFLICEILSLFIFNLSQLAGNFIEKSFAATTIIFGFILLSSSAVYAVIVIILSHNFSASVQPDGNLPNGKNHTLSDFTTLSNNEEQNGHGFTSFRLHSFFKIFNNTTPLSNYTISNSNRGELGEFEDVELGEKNNKSDIITSDN